jgi:hypothetical protein
VAQVVEVGSALAGSDETVLPNFPKDRSGYGAISDQNTCTSKSPLDGLGSP